jgi:hypothetical protein
MKAVTTIEEARRLIESFTGKPEDFELPIANELLAAARPDRTVVPEAWRRRISMPTRRRA